MSDDFYTDLRSDVDEMLAEYGQEVTVIRAVPADFDPVSGGVGLQNATKTLWGVAFPFEQRFINGITVLAGDVRLTLQASQEMVPMVGDDVKLATNEVYSVVSVKPLAPGGVTLLYEVQLRR